MASACKCRSSPNANASARKRRPPQTRRSRSLIAIAAVDSCVAYANAKAASTGRDVSVPIRMQQRRLLAWPGVQAKRRLVLATSHRALIRGIAALAPMDRKSCAIIKADAIVENVFA